LQARRPQASLTAAELDALLGRIVQRIARPAIATDGLSERAQFDVVAGA
jgi:hypothetical protein